MMATLEDDTHVWPEPEAAQPAARQSPGPMLHDVYRENDNELLNPVAFAVEVKGRGLAGRKEAVAKATANLPESEQYGTFRVVKHGEMSEPITRTQKTEPVDVWS